MSQNTPVISSATDPEQGQEFERFLEYIQTTPRAVIAEREAERLAPYFDALAEVLAEDQQQAKPSKLPEELERRFLAKAEGTYISKLFNAVAKDTRNVVLSEMLIIPVEFLDEKFPEGTEGYVPRMSYGNHSYFFGFKQVFSKDKQGSVSLPVLSFDPFLMSAIKQHDETKTVLEEFQRIMTAGNHDMLHHFGNEVLSSNVADTPDSFGSLMMSWYNKYFGNRPKSGGDGDHNPKSWESWLMLNHARVRRKLEQGPEANALKESCDKFFDALERLRDQVVVAKSPEKAHEVVDYFGTMLGFTMMRYMPLGHPLIDHAIARLQEIDPLPEQVLEKKADILKEMGVRSKKAKHIFLASAVKNYAADGVILKPKNLDYSALKKMQIFLFAPWMAHLMSKAQPNTMLASAQKRVGKANFDMMEMAAARHDAFSLPDEGEFKFSVNGAIIEKNIKNGQYYSQWGAPGFIQILNGGLNVWKMWYKDGEISHKIDVSNGYVTQEWFSGKDLHRDNDLPAVVRIDGGGDHRAVWYQHGVVCRDDDKPAKVSTGADNKVTEQWYLDGKLGRKGDLPAEIECKADGATIEYWFEQGDRHRDWAPACIGKDAEGRVNYEAWYTNGKMTRDDGPALLRIDSEGIRTEGWYENGQRHRENGPAIIVTDKDGNVIKEQWCRRGEEIPAPEKKLAPVKQTAVMQL